MQKYIGDKTYLNLLNNYLISDLSKIVINKYLYPVQGAIKKDNHKNFLGISESLISSYRNYVKSEQLIQFYKNIKKIYFRTIERDDNDIYTRLLYQLNSEYYMFLEYSLIHDNIYIEGIAISDTLEDLINNLVPKNFKKRFMELNY